MACLSCFGNGGVTVASGFRVIRPYLPRVRIGNRGIVGGRRVTVSHAWKKTPTESPARLPPATMCLPCWLYRDGEREDAYVGRRLYRQRQHWRKARTTQLLHPILQKMYMHISTVWFLRIFDWFWLVSSIAGWRSRNLRINRRELIQRHRECQNMQNRRQLVVFPTTDLLLRVVLSTSLAWRGFSLRTVGRFCFGTWHVTVYIWFTGNSRAENERGFVLLLVGRKLSSNLVVIRLI